MAQVLSPLGLPLSPPVQEPFSYCFRHKHRLANSYGSHKLGSHSAAHGGTAGVFGVKGVVAMACSCMSPARNQTRMPPLPQPLLGRRTLCRSATNDSSSGEHQGAEDSNPPMAGKEGPPPLQGRGGQPSSAAEEGTSSREAEGGAPSGEGDAGSRKGDEVRSIQSVLEDSLAAAGDSEPTYLEGWRRLARVWAAITGEASEGEETAKGRRLLQRGAASVELSFEFRRILHALASGSDRDRAAADLNLPANGGSSSSPASAQGAASGHNLRVGGGAGGDHVHNAGEGGDYDDTVFDEAWLERQLRVIDGKMLEELVLLDERSLLIREALELRTRAKERVLSLGLAVRQSQLAHGAGPAATTDVAAHLSEMSQSLHRLREALDAFETTIAQLLRKGVIKRGALGPTKAIGEKKKAMLTLCQLEDAITRQLLELDGLTRAAAL